MYRKGALLVFLTIALILGFATTGWAGGGQEPTAAVTITLDDVDTPTVQDNTPVQQYLEKKYGVKLKLSHMATGDAREQAFAAAAAAGDLPDVIFATGGTIDANVLQKQDLIGPIDKAAFQKYAPKTYAAIVNGGKTYGYDPWYGSTIDGKVYGFTTNPVSGLDMTTMSGMPYVRAWRLDLLKKIGFNQVPETIDQMAAIGAAQVAADPSIYMISGGAKNIYNQFATDIYGAFGYLPGNWVYVGGKIQWSSVLDTTKQAVTLLADWYKKGYIDPDWLTQDAAADRNKFATGKTLSQTWTGLTDLYPQGRSAWAADAVKADPNADPEPSPWVKGPTGKAGWPTYTLWGQGAQHMFSKKMAADPVKMQKYYQLLDGYVFDPDTQFTISYGIKGTHWTMDGDKLKVLQQLTADQANAVGNARPFMFAFAFDNGKDGLGRKAMSDFDKAQETWGAAYIQAHSDVFNLKNKYYNLDIAPMPDDLRKTANAIKDVMRTAIDGIIIGTKPLSAFDDAVKQWTDAGGDQLTTFINANDMRFIPQQ